jgi:hypothetical protein
MNSTEATTPRRKAKFLADFRKRPQDLEVIISALEKANEKDEGAAVTFTDLVLQAVTGLKKKDFEILHENSITPKMKLRKLYAKHIKESDELISFEEFVCNRLKI